MRFASTLTSPAAASDVPASDTTLESCTRISCPVVTATVSPEMVVPMALVRFNCVLVGVVMEFRKPLTLCLEASSSDSVDCPASSCTPLGTQLHCRCAIDPGPLRRQVLTSAEQHLALGLDGRAHLLLLPW